MHCYTILSPRLSPRLLCYHLGYFESAIVSELIVAQVDSGQRASLKLGFRRDWGLGFGV